MWAIGVICYVLLSGLSPFMGDTDIDTMTNVTLGKYNFDDDAFKPVSNCAKDFIRKLLQKDGRYVRNIHNRLPLFLLKTQLNVCLINLARAYQLRIH